MPLNYFIPKALKTDPAVYRSSRLIILVDLLLLVSAAIFIPIYWWIGYTAGAWIMGYTVVNATAFLFLMYYTRNFFLCGNFFCANSWLVFTSLIITSGGTDSPHFMWLLSIPPIGIFYMRARFAYFWSFLTLGTAVFIAIAQFSGLPFEQNISATYRPIILIFNYIGLLLLFMAVVFSFKSGYARINKKLKRANEKLQVSNAELERFAYIASHDLKSPLRNVVSFLDLFLRRHGENVGAEPKEYLDIAKKNAVQMQHLIEDILEYSKSSNAQLKEEEVDLNQMLKLICDQLKTNPSNKNTEVTVWSLPQVIADSTRMHQLFQNLVENGLKYNQSARPSVEVKYFSEENDHYFIIEDNGIGIPEKYHHRIFKMFERLHTRETYNGTGIGLAICLKNIQEYGGRIEIDSEEGRGTRFHLRFPKANLVELVPINRALPELSPV